MGSVFIKREGCRKSIHPRDQRMHGPGMTRKGAIWGKEGIGRNDVMRLCARHAGVPSGEKCDRHGGWGLAGSEAGRKDGGVPGMRRRAIPAQPLLTLPVAQGLGAERQLRGRQRRLQQEQAGTRHQQREQGGEERGGRHLGTRAPEATRRPRGRHGHGTFPRAASALSACFGNFRLPATVSPGNSGRLASQAPPYGERPNPVEPPGQRRPGVVVPAHPPGLRTLLSWNILAQASASLWLFFPLI